VGGFRTSRTIVWFGDFELDQDSGELRREGARVRLQEQPLQILQILLEEAGEQRLLSVLQELQELSKESYVPACWRAIISGDLNEKDEAFSWLESSYREREAWMALLKYWVMVDPLRSDPRFDDLLRRMNFPDGIYGAGNKAS